MVNWNALQEQYGSTYAQEGKYKVKVKEIKVADKSATGSCRVDIEFEKKDGLSYPKATYWLSFKDGANEDWRAFQHMSIMKNICKSEEQAKKAIDTIEGKDTPDERIKAYQDFYKKLGEKHNEVEIEVYPEEGSDGRTYTRSQLVGDGPLSNQRREAPKKQESLLDEAEALTEEDLSAVPF